MVGRGGGWSHSRRNVVAFVDVIIVVVLLTPTYAHPRCLIHSDHLHVGAVVAIGVLDIAAIQNGANANSTEVRLNSLTDSVRMYQIRVGEEPGDLQMLVDGPTDAAAKAK